MLCNLCTKGKVHWQPKQRNPSHPSNLFEGLEFEPVINKRMIDVILPTCSHFGFAISGQIHKFLYIESQNKITSKGTISNKEYPNPLTMLKKNDYLMVVYCKPEAQGRCCFIDVYFGDKLLV